MSKVRSPLLSLAASGPVGKSVSYRKRGRETVAEKRPVVPDQRTWPQRRHRFDYQNYAVWWLQLSEADKDTWRAVGRGLRITGFNAWMQDRLSRLPDIMGRWWLDEGGGNLVRDSGKLGNNGTVIGALWVPGPMHGGLWSDGVDDRVDLPADGDLKVYGGMSIEFGMELYSADGDAGVVLWTPDGGNGYKVFVSGSNLSVYGMGAANKYGWVTLGVGVKRHIILTFDPSLGSNELKAYRDGKFYAQTDSAGDVGYGGVVRLHLFRRGWGGGHSLKGTAYYATILNRVLTLAEVQVRNEQWESEL